MSDTKPKGPASYFPSIEQKYVFDGEISDDDAEAISGAETEVIADFPSQTAVCFRLERCDPPLSIKHNADEELVFRRLER